MSNIDAFYNERSDTLTLSVGGVLTTLTAKDAWDLLYVIERELYGPSLDRKDD